MKTTKKYFIILLKKTTRSNLSCCVATSFALDVFNATIKLMQPPNTQTQMVAGPLPMLEADASKG